MNWKPLPLALAAVLMLSTGCSSLLTRDYAWVEPHSDTPVSAGDSDTLRVDSYQALVNALVYLVDKGADSGTIRFDQADQDVKTMLDEACLEVAHEDPLGAYAVDYIKYTLAQVVATYEADINITYRRTREEVAAIADATGASAIRSELQQALATFSDQVVLRINYFEGDESYIQDLVREAYLANPASALDYPESSITLYPDHGERRIVEIVLTYHLSAQTLESRKNSLTREAQRIVDGLTHLPDEALPQALAQAVLDAGGYLAQGDSTAYAALLEGGGNDQALALAMALLCQQAGIPCQVVDGSLNGQSHIWNVVKTSQGYRHMDLTQGTWAIGSDTVWSQSGYQWDTERIPPCPAS